MKKKKTSNTASLLIIALPGILYLLINNYIPLFGLFIAFKDYKFSKGKIEYKLHSIDERQSGFDLNDDGKITIYYEQVIKAQNPFYQSVTKGIGKKLFNGELQKLTGKTKKKTVKKLYDNTAANRKKRIK